MSTRSLKTCQNIFNSRADFMVNF